MNIQDIISIICQMYSSTPLFEPPLYIKSKEHKLTTTGRMMYLAIEMIYGGDYYA